MSDSWQRRKFLKVAVLSGAGVAACVTPAEDRFEIRTKGGEDEAEVTPCEDLMQEHGALDRIMLIYDEAARLIGAQKPFEPSVIAKAASIVRGFVEDYHEQNEEEFVFPRLQSHKTETELVTVLFRQHREGRGLTREILARANAGKADEKLASLLGAFTRMYRPHAAREETVLFEAFRTLIGKKAYRELGEKFEEDEHRRFGEHGFEHTVKQIAQLERELGIDELSSFSPA